MTWCTYLQSFEKIQQCVQTDRQTDGGRCNISRPGSPAPREIIWKQSDKDFLSYRENDEMSADAAAADADAAKRRLNHSIPCMYIRTGDTINNRSSH